MSCPLMGSLPCSRFFLKKILTLPSFQGLTWDSLKRHYSLMPLFFAMACGGVMVIGYMARSALYGSDVTWTKDPQPYDYYK